MNPIVNMSKYRNCQILASEFGDEYMYCGWGNRRLGLATSPLANPYTEKSNARAGRIRVANRDEAVEMYRVWLWERICADDQAVKASLSQVTPATALICWCAPKRCHCSLGGWRVGYRAKNESLCLEVETLATTKHLPKS